MNLRSSDPGNCTSCTDGVENPGLLLLWVMENGSCHSSTNYWWRSSIIINNCYLPIIRRTAQLIQKYVLGNEQKIPFHQPMHPPDSKISCYVVLWCNQMICHVLFQFKNIWAAKCPNANYKRCYESIKPVHVFGLWVKNTEKTHITPSYRTARYWTI